MRRPLSRRSFRYPGGENNLKVTLIERGNPGEPGEALDFSTSTPAHLPRETSSTDGSKSSFEDGERCSRGNSAASSTVGSIPSRVLRRLS